MKVFMVEPKPITLIQAINRVAASMGSPEIAKITRNSDYIGHDNYLDWNSYRGWYVGQRGIGGRCVFIRSSSFVKALDYSLREFDGQGAGATLTVRPNGEDIHIALDHPRLIEYVERPSPWQFGEISFAIRMEREFCVPHIIHLLEASSPEDYRDRVRAEFKRRRSCSQSS